MGYDASKVTGVYEHLVSNGESIRGNNLGDSDEVREKFVFSDGVRTAPE